MLDKPLAWETSLVSSQKVNSTISGLWEEILRGAYPEMVSQPGRDARMWQASYVQTYLERDVRNLRDIGDLTLFQTYLRCPGKP